MNDAYLRVSVSYILREWSPFTFKSDFKKDVKPSEYRVKIHWKIFSSPLSAYPVLIKSSESDQFDTKDCGRNTLSLETSLLREVPKYSLRVGLFDNVETFAVKRAF